MRLGSIIFRGEVGATPAPPDYDVERPRRSSCLKPLFYWLSQPESHLTQPPH